ncbi:reverse transcriptase domain-containing protein [Tanacetum coccineum]
MVQWTTEADEAFRRMKELLEALPTGVETRKVRAKAKGLLIMGEIKFRGRNSIKGQILADFLAETPSKEEEGAEDEEAKRKEPEPKKAWKFFTDGASSFDGSRKQPNQSYPEEKEDSLRPKVEAKPLTSTTGKHMERFVWEHIVCRFGTPKIIISDNGKQFAEGTFLVFYQKLRILQSLTSVYHPQANGQVEVTNREIVKGMERRLGKTHQGWVDELPQVLWAHRTTPKSSNGETPFSLVYGSEAVIPIEISIETRRIQDFDPKQNEKRRREDLDILEERREIASIKEAHYKQKLEGYYNKRVRPSTFKPGTYVLRLNSASKAEFQGKMGPTWEGPYIVKKAYGDGAYKQETLSGFLIDRTWNRSNLRKFYI